MSHSVLLVEDHCMIREALRLLIQNENWLEVAGEAEDGKEAVEKCKELVPDVVVMDVKMANLNGVEATRRIKKFAPDTKIVAVSVQSDKQTVVKMMKAGAEGYVAKDSASEELIKALRAVTQDQAYLSPGAVKEVLSDRIRMTPGREDGDLSPREEEVIALVAEGHTSREIADKLDISQKTVDNHRQNIMEKLDLHNIPALTKYAVREGLTELAPRGQL